MPSSIKVALLNSDNKVATLSNNQPIVLEYNTPDTVAAGSLSAPTTIQLSKLGWVPLLVQVEVASRTPLIPDCEFYFTRRNFSTQYELLGRSNNDHNYSVTVEDIRGSIKATLINASSDYVLFRMWGYNYVLPVSKSSDTILTNSDHTAIIPFHGPGVEYIDKNQRRCYMSVPLPLFDSSVELSVNATNSFCIEKATTGDLLSPQVVLGVAMADCITGAYPTHANLLTDTNRTNVLRQENTTNLLQTDGIAVSNNGLTWDPVHYGFLCAADTRAGRVYDNFLLDRGYWVDDKDVDRSIVNGSYNNGGENERFYFLAITFEQWAYYDGITITRE